MSLSEQPRRARLMLVVGAERRTQFAGHERVEVKGVVLRLPQQNHAQRILPARPIRSRWLMLVRFASKIEMLFSDMMFAFACWISTQFLAGCALYAQGMLFIPETKHDPVDAAEPTEPARPAGKATIHASRRE